MSLSREVENPQSPVGRFLREFFPAKNNRSLLAEIHGQLDVPELSCRLEESTPSWVHSIIGQAIDYRIRYHFDNTPANQFSMALEGAWAVTRTNEFFDALRADPSRFPDYMITPFGDTPKNREYVIFSDIEIDEGNYSIWSRSTRKSYIRPSMLSALYQARYPDLEYLPLDCTLGFFGYLDQISEKIAAHRRRPTPEEELDLARLCLVLSVFESLRRSGGRGWPPQFFGEKLPQNATELINTIPILWVEDVASLATTFVEHHSAWRGASAVLNPVLPGARDVGGADGDLIIDGCLWEIKTTMRERARGRWLYQLLGYVILDYENEYAIDRAGFLFPRQNKSIHWSLPALIRRLSGRTDLSMACLRQQLSRRLRSEIS